MDLSNETLVQGGVGVFIIKALWEMVMSRQKQDSTTMAKMNDTLNQLSIAITELRVEIRWLRETVSDIPVMKQDIEKIKEQIKPLI